MSLWSLRRAFVQKAEVRGTPQKVVFLPGCPGSSADQGRGRSPHVWLMMKWTCPLPCRGGEAVPQAAPGLDSKDGQFLEPTCWPTSILRQWTWLAASGRIRNVLDFGRACFFKEAGDCHVHSGFSVESELTLPFLLPEPPCHLGWYNTRGGGMCVGGWTSSEGDAELLLIGSWSTGDLQNEMWPCSIQSVGGSFHQLNSWSLFIRS